MSAGQQARVTSGHKLLQRSSALQADPSSPNILSVPFVADDVLAKLRRPFWTELESRFGNMFYVREQASSYQVGHAAAAVSIPCCERMVAGALLLTQLW